MAGDVKNDVYTAFLGVLRAYQGWPAIQLVRFLTWGSLGLMCFLPFFAWRENKNLFLRWVPYWGTILATLLIALNGDRRVGSLFPVLIVTSLNGLNVLARRLHVRIEDFYVVFLVQFALLLLKRDVPIVPFDLAAAAFLVTLCWLLLRGESETNQPIEAGRLVGEPSA
jgi:hypothetical protein